MNKHGALGRTNIVFLKKLNIKESNFSKKKKLNTVSV